LDSAPLDDAANSEHLLPFVPYNLLTQHSIPDKSLADCVEALIGAYLIACGPRGALLFMSWLGIRVLPEDANVADNKVAITHKIKSSILTLIYSALRETQGTANSFAALRAKPGERTRQVALWI
jgi:hypothetical protein